MKSSSPRRLAVIHALLALSPEGYDLLARMILSTARSEQDALDVLHTQSRPEDPVLPDRDTHPVAVAQSR